jgi:predicted metal-dependent peptidase
MTAPDRETRWSSEDVNRLFAAAWRPDGPSAIVEVIAPYACDLEHARRLARAWLPKPLQPGDATPSLLPTGEPVPPGETPWLREHSPVSGVDIKESVVLNWAWKAVELPLFGADDLDKIAVALPHFVPGVQSVAAKLVDAWVGSMHPLACIRAVWPPRDPPGWLHPIEIEDLYERLRGGGPEVALEHLHTMWRTLVEAGADPTTILEALADWMPWSAQLPTGQWVPRHLLAPGRIVAGAICLCGHWIPLDLLDIVKAMTAEGKRKAAVVEKVRCATDVSREDALELVTAILRGELDGESPTDKGDVPDAAEAHFLKDPLDAAIAQLVVDLPFHWAVLAGAHIVEDTTIPTMAIGVTKTGVATLFHNPRFSRTISLRDRMGVLTHEVNHLILAHCEGMPTTGRRAKTGARTIEEEAHDRLAWMLACECTANEFVSFPLPGEPITIASLRLPSNESTQKRYTRLRTRKRLPPLEGGFFDALGHCVALDAATHADSQPGHPRVTETLLAALEETGGEIDEDTGARLRGLHPGLFSQLITPDRITELPWTTLMRLVTKTAQDRVALRTFPSRRQPHLVGIVPGRRKRRGRTVALVAVDTSASLTNRELLQISGEVWGLMRTGVKVGLVQCDAEICEQRWLKPGEEITRLFGRGGTDLRPPFDLRVLRKFQPDILVYFTDGGGPAPEEAPAGVAVLWVLTGEAPEVPARWGRAVTMRPRHRRRHARSPRG